MDKPSLLQPNQALNSAYQYNYTYLESIAMVDKLPQGENFSQPWLVLTGQQAIKLAINTLIANQGDRGQKGVDDDVREFLGRTLFQTLQEEGASFKSRLIAALMNLLPQLLLSHTSVTKMPITQTEVKVSRTIETMIQPISEEVSIEGTTIGVTQIETTLQQTTQQTTQQTEPQPILSTAGSQAGLTQPPLPQIPSPQLVLDLNPATSQAEVSKGIEAALQQLLESVPSIEVASGTAIPEEAVRMEKTLQQPLAGVPSPTSKTEFMKGIARALQQPLAGVPANEAEVEKFVDSDLVKVLGEEFLKTFAKNILKRLRDKAPSGRPNSMEDYRKLFPYLGVPAVADQFQEDEFFAYTRVAGPNPVLLTRMTTADARFPVTEAQYQAVMGTGSLLVAMQEGRVYLADFAILDGALNGTVGAEPPVQKYAYAPLAMFAVPPSDAANRLLRPIAIQCGQSPVDYPVITPATGTDAWRMAKTIVQIADVNFHEAVSHFARTHLLVEPFVIATHRQLPANHSLFTLLVPHFQGTLAINNAAHQFLIAPNGGVNELLSCTIDQSRVFMVKGFQGRGFNADMLPRRLEDQGVADATMLPIYPYRDDGLLIWQAIHDWVKAYLELYYRSDAEVQGDRALQNWAQELVAFDGGRLPDFGDRGNGRIETLSYLVDAVTMVIFTGSAQHAAVNFPQEGIMSFAPAMPTAGYIPAQAIESGVTPEDWLALLPPIDQAQSQLNLLYLLGSVYFTQLGQYEPDHFTDVRVTQPLLAFQNRLKQIEATIEQRNQNRLSYDYLRPSKIPQSINI